MKVDSMAAMRDFLRVIKVSVWRLSNPVFFVLLLLSLGMWYVTKLSYDYTTQITVPVRIDSTYYSVRCTVEGEGYYILLHKVAPRKNMIVLSSDNIALTPSATASGTYEISSFALQNIISDKIKDLQIKSVESSVEIEVPAQKP